MYDWLTAVSLLPISGPDAEGSPSILAWLPTEVTNPSTLLVNTNGFEAHSTHGHGRNNSTTIPTRSHFQLWLMYHHAFQLLPNLAQAMTAELSWLVQNFVVIGSIDFDSEQKQNVKIFGKVVTKLRVKPECPDGKEMRILCDSIYSALGIHGPVSQRVYKLITEISWKFRLFSLWLLWSNQAANLRYVMATQRSWHVQNCYPMDHYYLWQINMKFYNI